MFNVNDVVIYTLYGICQINDITERVFNGQNMKYYVLVPLTDQRTKMTIPVDNPLTLQRLHSLILPDDANTIIEEIPFLESYWIDNDNQRKRDFGEIVKNGNRKEILQMMKSIYTHSLGLKNKGRKLHASDDQCMRDGEKLILDEFAYVLQKDRLLLAQDIKSKFEG